MNKKIICLMLISMMLVLISNVAANNWIIEGDTVCTDNETWGELCMNPHTLHGPGYAYCNATMAENYGNIDFVWGFNTSLERPRSMDLYNPHWDNTSSTQFFQNVSNIVICDDICEIGHEYNDIKRNVTYDRCSVWNETTMECEEYEQVTQTVCFDSYEQDGNNYTVTYHNAKMKYWTDKTHLIESVNYNWNGMNKWYYIKDISMPANVTKTVRIWIDMPVVLGTGTNTKFFFAAKRTTDTIQEAIAADRFMVLDPWHNASRSHRKTVNVTHVNSTGSNLLNYTVFLNVSKETEMQADFDDILFYETDGTAMSFEYENHTASYGLFWVLVPTLMAVSDTQFWMYYGNDAATSSSNPESSWNVNCSMVQHLQEAPANDTAGHLDSTSNDNDGTPKNFDSTPTSTTDGTGIVDGADVFDGADDFVDCGSDSSLDDLSEFTVSGWYKIDSDGDDRLWTKQSGGYKLLQVQATNKIQFQIDLDATNALSYSGNNAFTQGEWVHITGTYIDSGDRKAYIYVNGIENNPVQTAGVGSLVSEANANFIIGARSAGLAHFNGQIDQVRIYNRALSANEINQSYQLVENQSTFVTWGSAEAGGPTLHIGNAINIKEDWGRDFNSNLSANVTVANASDVWMNFTNAEFTNTSLGWVNLTLNEWVNETHNVNSPVTNISIDVTLNSTTSGATNDTESFYYEITNRTNTATMDSTATQNVETSETFHINGTCNEEYSDTFLGAANLLEDGAIIDTDNSVTDYVNFSHSESVAGQYNYTIRFYNLTHYNNATTPTYSNVTVTEPTYMPPDPTNLQNTTGNYWVNYTWDAGTPGNITNSYNVSWNSTWYNTTLVTFMNDTVGEFGWANITVWAYNSTGNGSLSAGNVTDDTQAGGGTFITNMNTGVWNLISYYNSTNGTAEIFGIDIGNVDYVAKYNGSFYTHTMGMSLNNFTTVHGMSYFVFLNASGSSTYIRNTIPDGFYNTSIYNRWNTIGWTNATATDAFGLTDTISIDCNFAAKLKTDGINHTTYTRGFIGNRFTVDRGYGYWIWNSNDTVWGRNS